MEEILHNLFKIEVPLPQNPLRAVNSYVIKSSARSLIIDTGMNREECKDMMLSSLGKLGIDLNSTDFFITHRHTDHLGLVARLSTASSKVYSHQKEISMLGFHQYWQGVGDSYRQGGFPAAELEKALKNHPGYKYDFKGDVNFCSLADGDVIECGNYRFRCVETPGHSPGHMCLYEANKKLLISGDHILQDVTPNISLWPDFFNPLKDYLASLDRVGKLEIDMVLPGHGRVFKDCGKRIDELKQHHEKRAGEILSSLADGEKNAYQLSSMISWDIGYDSWEKFPPTQKWFAVGETLAHLRFLEYEGLIKRSNKANSIVFSPV